jgi:hypothetical protein
MIELWACKQTEKSEVVKEFSTTGWTSQIQHSIEQHHAWSTTSSVWLMAPKYVFKERASKQQQQQCW